MRENRARRKLLGGSVTVGPLLMFGSPDLAEQAGHLGFDWVFLDWQHGQWTETTLNDAIARFLMLDSVPLVRVKSHESGTVNRVLDMGAMGVIVPQVENADQARLITQAVYYPPLGGRSGGGMRLPLISSEYYAKANEEIILVLMVESMAAVANVASIMEVPGVHVVLIGPGDLMIDVRARGHNEAHFERLVSQVAEAAKQAGVVVGYPCSRPDVAERRIAQGFRFILYGSDYELMMSGLRELRAQSAAW